MIYRLAIVLLFVFLSLQPTTTNAQVLDACPIPPFAEGTSASPNVLLILDHSGSMGNGNGSRWETAKSVLKDIIDTFPNIRFGLMRMDGSNYGGQDQIGVENVVRQGGKILRPVGTPGADIKAYIDTHMGQSNEPQTWTVLAETLASAGRYFATVDEGGGRVGKGPAGFGFYQKNYHYTHANCAAPGCDATTTDDYGTTINTLSPILNACQKSFVIFLSDGLANFDNDWNVVTSVIGDYDNDNEAQDCSHGTSGCHSGGRTTYLNDVAKFLYDHDMRSDLPGMHNIVTHVIGFQIDDPLLSTAASQGGGHYYTADTADELTDALQDALQDILSQISSATAVATISTSTASDDIIIRAKFLPGSWKGYLEAFTLPMTEGDTPTWEAGEVLSSRDPASRDIFTFLAAETPTKQSFTAANTTVKNHLMTLWNVNDAEAADRINYVRGVDLPQYRNRDGWPLGDIIHSSPVYIGPPRFPYLDPDYQAFKTQHANRQAAVLVGANDGMLHAFHAANGSELWGFIPEGALAQLPTLTTTGCHEYYVDLSPKAADIWNGSAWQTVLCGGNRLADAEDHWCLDITSPNANAVAVLWDQVLFPNRKSSTQPLIAAVQPVDKWVAIVTSGYDEGTNVGKIAAIDFVNGTKQAIWHSGGGPVVESDLQAKSPSNPYYSLSTPNGVDEDNDGYIDLIYVGDTEGSLWKFYYHSTDNVWKKVELFQTGGQPITTRPIIALGEDDKLIIYFGTGQYLVGVDKANVSQNAFYAIVEKKVSGYSTSETPLNKDSEVVNLSNVTTQVDFDDLSDDTKTNVSNYGWYFNLDDPEGNPSERVIEEALVVSGTVFFISFIPNEDICGFGGNARLYAVDYLSGVQNGVIPYQANEKYQDLGPGVPSKPVYDVDKKTLEKQILVQTSDSTVHVEKPTLPDKSISILYWKPVN